MALYLPRWLEWLEWVAGSDWPHGNEDSMWEMSRELRAIGADVEQLLDDLDTATRTTLAVYPAGEGRDQMSDFLDQLRSGDGSLVKLAENFTALADSADEMGDQLQAAKLNVISGLVLLAAELAYAAFLGPGAPFAQAGAIAAAQAAFRWLGMRLLGFIERVVGRLIANQVARTITTRMVYEITQEAIVEALQGAAQELSVQAIQVTGGHKDGFDWGAVGLNAGISAVAGGAGGAGGSVLNHALPTGLPGVFRGALTGAGAGAIGAGAAYGATGLFTGNWEFDPRMLTGGVIGGIGPSAVYGARGMSDLSGAPMPAGGIPPGTPGSGDGTTAAPGDSSPGMSPASGQTPAGAAPVAEPAAAAAESDTPAGGVGGGSRGDRGEVDAGSADESPSETRAGGTASGSAGGSPGGSTDFGAGHDGAGDSGAGRDGTADSGSRTDGRSESPSTDVDSGTQHDLGGDVGAQAANGDSGRTDSGTQATDGDTGVRHDGAGDSGARHAENGGEARADGDSGGRGDSGVRGADPDRAAPGDDGSMRAAQPDAAGSSTRDGATGTTAPPAAGPAPSTAGRTAGPATTASPTAGPATSPTTGTTTNASPTAGPATTASPTAGPATSPTTGTTTNASPTAGPATTASPTAGPATTPTTGTTTNAANASPTAAANPASGHTTNPGSAPDQQNPATAAQPTTNRPAAGLPGTPGPTTPHSRAGAAPADLPFTPIDAAPTGHEAPQQVRHLETTDIAVTPILTPDPGTRPGPGTPPRTTSTAGNGDGSVPRPATPDDDSRQPGNCAADALSVAATRTPRGTVTIPDEAGPRGITAEAMEEHAGTRLREATSHDQVIADLHALGDGATVIVVDEYPGPANSYDVGAHAYVLTLDNGTVTVHDDALPGGSLPLSEWRAAQPVSRILALSYDADGTPSHPVTTHPHEVGPLARIGEPPPAAGVVESVGEAHGSARVGDPLTDADILARVVPDLRLITPGDIIWNRTDGVFELSGGEPRRTIRLRAGQVPANHLATFTARPDGSGYDITLSPGTRDGDVTRVVANALAEIQLAERGSGPSPAGRFAELRVLATGVDRALADPTQAGQLAPRRRTLAELAAQLDSDGALPDADPALAQRLRLEQLDALGARPQFSPTLTDADFDAAVAEHLARLEQHLTGEHADSLRAAEQLGLAGRMHEELARRVFDPVFDPATATARKPIRAALDDLLGPITEAINAPGLDPARRAAALHAAIDGLANSEVAAPALRAALDVDAMHRAADAFAAAPARIGAELDRSTGTVRLEQDLPGLPRGTELTVTDLLHLIDEANRGAVANGIDVDYVLIIHDAIGDRATLQVLSRPQPQHRLPLEQNLRHTDGAPFTRRPLPSARPAAEGAHTVDVGVGRSAFAAEMTPDVDRSGGGVVIQTELTSDYANAGQRRRDLGVLDPGALPVPGAVTVYADLLGGGGFLNAGRNGGVGRIFVNNVSAHFSEADYDALARSLPAALAPGARIDVQWDMKSERADGTGHPSDRGHIRADLLLDAIRRVHPPAVAEAFRIVESQVFAHPGNENYLYSIDAGVRNVMNAAAMARFAPPIPDHRMVIGYEPGGTATADLDPGAAELVQGSEFRRAVRAAARVASEGTGRGVLEEIQQFTLQRVLSRIFTQNPDVWVLKGGQGMLTRIPGGRPSTDIDLVRIDGADRDAMIRDYEAALATEHGDHLRFVFESAQDLDTAGVRLFHRAYLGAAEVMRLGIDLNPERAHPITGEPFPMHRPPEMIDFPQQILWTDRMPPAPRIPVLSVEDTLAHKIAGMYTYGYRTEETKCDDCVLNPAVGLFDCQKAGSELPYRPQDMADVLLLAQHARFDGAAVQEILRRELAWRREQNATVDVPGRFELPNPSWATWFAQHLRTTDALPFGTLQEALPLADRFLSPLFAATTLDAQWDPGSRRWVPVGEVAAVPIRQAPGAHTGTPVPGTGTGPRAPTEPEGVRRIEGTGRAPESTVFATPERISDWERLARGPRREDTVGGILDRILASAGLTVENRVYALHRALNAFADQPETITGMDDRHLRFYVHQSGEEYIHALALIVDPSTTLEIAYQPLRAYTATAADAHQSHIAYLGDLPPGMTAAEANAVAFARWVRGAPIDGISAPHLIRELLELHARPFSSALTIRERLISDYGIEPHRVRIVEAPDGRDPVYTGSRWLRAHLFTLGPLRDHPIETRAAIVDALLGEGPVAQDRVARVDATVRGLLDRHETAGRPLKYTLLWVRDTRPFGSRGAELDTRPGYIRQLIEELRAHQPDRQLVLIGDDLFAGRAELRAAWRRAGVLTGVDTTSLVEFWAPHGLSRAEQALFFHRLGTARDVVQIGMESGALETQTVLGLPTVYLSATEHGGNKANRWLHYSEPWQFGRTALAADESGAALDPATGLPVRTFERIGEQLPPPLTTIERVPVGPDLADPVNRRGQPVAVYRPAKVSVQASRILSLLETGQIDRWADRLGRSADATADQWTSWTDQDWDTSRTYAGQLAWWLHTEVSEPESAAAKWDAVRLALRGVVEPGYAIDETAVTAAVVHPYFTLYTDEVAPAHITRPLAEAYAAPRTERPAAVAAALRHLLETADVTTRSVADLAVFTLDGAELRHLREAIDRVVSRNGIHPPVPYDAPPGGSAWDAPGAATHSRLPAPDRLWVPPYYRTDILGGDGSGGHRFGTGAPGKTEFPQRWDDATALAHILDVARSPERALFQANGYWYVIGVRDGVVLTVIVRPDGRIRAAWPESGDGVFRNPAQ
ncbi:nucleotidyl transferase AbiEii/AbiGii toxin family protein [Nocardia harenae]|uniref:nucleotidyl transferase AbiEii/AbiGii toxin family protein n=1 Tax=Nocardia harenae TaxID=358707 RepID=UPI000833E129|nr:nucleotidyl transferase AbiEii/AbiGii toxin family protein [Nocardia harenae]